MLHGPIRINEYAVGLWEAQRRDPLPAKNPDDSINDYSCVVALASHSTWKPDFWWDGIVQHRYGDGPLVLLQKVLAAALEEKGAT
jgi:hypothetical protein